MRRAIRRRVSSVDGSTAVCSVLHREGEGMSLSRSSAYAFGIIESTICGTSKAILLPSIQQPLSRVTLFSTACCGDQNIPTGNFKDGPAIRGRFLFLGLKLRRTCDRIFIEPYRALASTIGGLVGAWACPTSQMAYCASGSCLRMPRPAGHERSSLRLEF